MLIFSSPGMSFNKTLKIYLTNATIAFMRYTINIIKIVVLELL